MQFMCLKILFGAIGFEPTTPCSQGRCATRPRYAPTTPAAGTWGSLGHNAARGPGRDNWNIALFKSFVFSEERGSRLEFRAESFNAWNHTQFQADTTGGINNSFGGGNFGQLTSTFDPRTMQLGLKLIF